jgi:eukaryotic-like serine/threonine-protein kinase
VLVWEAVARSPHDPLVGRILLERYRVIERISSGGMGVVYRGERVGLGRVVAIKFLHSTFAHTGDFLERFEREAKTMSRLDHPNCVSVIDFGVDGGPFFVMDYVSGVTLRELLDAGPIEPPRALSLARQILAGLAHAHERGIIHRDVKPANIMVATATGTGDQVRILDFGLAKLIGVDVTASAIVVGTPSYMSPEQAGGRPVDGRADIYAASVLLFELLTGDKPFSSDQAVQVIKMHLESPPPPLPARFSRELSAVVARGLAKDPADRFQTPGDLADALAKVPEARGVVVVPERDVSRDPTVAAPLPKRPAAPPPSGGAGWIVLLVLVGALGGGGYVVWQRVSRPPAVEPVTVASLAEADRLAAAGQGDRAISMLHELRRQQPGDAPIAMRLGALYADKGWRAESVAAYREALEREPQRARDAELIADVIAALADDVAADKAEQLLAKRIGRPAVAKLREAGKSASPKVKARIDRTLAAIP